MIILKQLNKLIKKTLDFLSKISDYLDDNLGHSTMGSIILLIIAGVIGFICYALCMQIINILTFPLKFFGF